MQLLDKQIEIGNDEIITPSKLTELLFYRYLIEKIYLLVCIIFKSLLKVINRIQEVFRF